MPRGVANQGALLGSGHVAMTIDPGGDMDRYQGIVALEREPLVDAAHTYFRQSEQLPTFIRLAVARHYGPSRPGGEPVWRWRAGGILIQHLSREGGKPVEGEAHDAGLEGDDNENWNRVRHLAATVEDHELLDPMLSPERLLYRLFHEEGVRVLPATRPERRLPLLARAHPRVPRPLRRRRAERHARGGRCHHGDVRVLLAQIPLRARSDHLISFDLDGTRYFSALSWSGLSRPSIYHLAQELEESWILGTSPRMTCGWVSSVGWPADLSLRNAKPSAVNAARSLLSLP